MVYLVWVLYVVAISIATTMRWMLVGGRESKMAIAIVVPNLLMVASMLIASSEPLFIPKTMEMCFDILVRAAATATMPSAVVAAFVAISARKHADRLLLVAVLLGTLFTSGLEVYAIVRLMALGIGGGWNWFPPSVAPWNGE